MQAYFYTFTKRRNSTKTPSGGMAYNVCLKASTSMLSPSIYLDWPGGAAPAYNYCYIPEFGRYYWCSWEWTERRWMSICTLDVLASWKSQIGAASKYVLRAAAEFDRNVTDGIYPAKSNSTNYIHALNGLDWSADLSNGSFVVGIVGNNYGFSQAGVSYVVATPYQLQLLINACFTETDYLWTSQSSLGSDVGSALAVYGEKFSKSILNPVQFINSVVWLPFVPNMYGNVNVYLGNLNTHLNLPSLGDPRKVFLFNSPSILPGTIAQDQGYWRHMEPFTRYKLVLPPFGTFNLPGPTVVEYGGIVSGSVKVDCITGQAVLELTNYAIEAVAELGIQIQLSGISVDYAGAMKAAVSAAGGAIGSLLRGDVVGAITGGVSGIISTAQAGAPEATQGGIGGGMAAINAIRYCHTINYPVVDEDNTEKGKPLCKVRTISDLTGYILCADGEVEAPATDGELKQIESYLTRGFFYE